MAMTKNTAARAAVFFQVDFDPDLGENVFLQVPELYRNRLILSFAVNDLSAANLAELKAWMNQKWREIPADGQKAFFNTLIAFLRRQTVVLGESGYHISDKVK